jgi:ABC-type multidrug transport system permease subunit
LQPLAKVVPTRFALNAVRGALFGAHDWIGPAVTLLGMGVVMLVLSLLLFSAAVRLVIKMGTVSQY